MQFPTISKLVKRAAFHNRRNRVIFILIFMTQFLQNMSVLGEMFLYILAKINILFIL